MNNEELGLVYLDCMLMVIPEKIHTPPMEEIFCRPEGEGRKNCF
jgi:hypothetical protein